MADKEQDQASGMRYQAVGSLGTAVVAWLLASAALQAQIQVLDPAQAQTAAVAAGVRLDEKLGDTIPLDLSFTDETGAKRTLRELVDRPTILILVFYHCPSACGMIQGSVAGCIRDIPFKLGEDYRILTVSFDDEETTELACETSTNYLSAASAPVPAGAWRFMTGDLDSIQKLLGAVGFHVNKAARHDYVHPNLITVLSKDGKIIRYLYGTSYLPLDVGMALTEASRGTPGVSIKKMVSYCYSYDPKSRRYSFRLIRVFGTTTLVVLGAFLFFLLRKKNDDPQEPGTSK